MSDSDYTEKGSWNFPIIVCLTHYNVQSCCMRQLKPTNNKKRIIVLFSVNCDASKVHTVSHANDKVNTMMRYKSNKLT